MPSAELTSIRQSVRDTLLGMWGEQGTWRALSDGGRQPDRTITVKVQWRSKMLLDRYADSEKEAAEVYLNRDESADATYPGVSEPTYDSTLELDAEPGRPLIFKGEVLEKSPDRIKIVMERNRRILTGGRG